MQITVKSELMIAEEDINKIDNLMRIYYVGEDFMEIFLNVDLRYYRQ
jgi:hypothetical protein